MADNSTITYDDIVKASRKLSGVNNVLLSTPSQIGDRVRGIHSRQASKRPSFLIMDEIGSINNTRIIESPTIGPKYDFCQNYECNRLCYDKKHDNYVCGKNGGQTIGWVPFDKCKLGIVAHALNVMNNKGRKITIGVDPAKHDDQVDALSNFTASFRSTSDYSKKLQYLSATRRILHANSV